MARPPTSHETGISLAIQILASISSSYLDLDSSHLIFSSDKHFRLSLTFSYTFLYTFVAGRPFAQYTSRSLLSPTANMQFQILAILSFVAFAFAAPVAQSTQAQPSGEAAAMSDASGNVVSFDSANVYLAPSNGA